MQINQKTQAGFTIVELLIVIIVIAILAAITIIAYNGIQERAKVTAASNDITNASKKAAISKIAGGSRVVTADLLSGDNLVKTTPNIYRVFAICGSSSGEYAVAAQLNSGDVYYSKNGGAPSKSTTIDATNPCNSLGMSGEHTIYAGMPSSSCATENGVCTFSGTQTIAYGSLAQGRFTVKTNQESPISCANPYFGDPASGFTKACYILQ